MCRVFNNTVIILYWDGICCKHTNGTSPIFLTIIIFMYDKVFIVQSKAAF